MLSLTKTLRAQHQAALALVGTVNEAIKENNRAVIAQVLSDLKTALVAHLDLEDRQLYPELIRVAQQKGLTDVEETTKSFSTAMTYISKAVLAFFDKYSGTAFDLIRFKKDFGGVCDELALRITAEETQLYDMYDRHVEGVLPARMKPTQARR